MGSSAETSDLFQEITCRHNTLPFMATMYEFSTDTGNLSVSSDC